MFYFIVSVSIIIIGVLLFNTNRIIKSLYQFNDAMKSLINKQSLDIEELAKKTSYIVEKIDLDEKKQQIKPFERVVKENNSYIDKMKGYFSQDNTISFRTTIWDINSLKCNNIKEEIKQKFYILFFNALEENKLNIKDLLVVSDYSHNHSTIFNINFKILNYRYIGDDRYTSVADIELTLKDGSKKLIEIDSYNYRYDIDYFDIENKNDYIKDIHFFDALKLTFNSFEYFEEFDGIYPYWNFEDNLSTVTINELKYYMSLVLKKNNVRFSYVFDRKFLDFKVELIDPSWSLIGTDYLIIKDDEEFNKLIEKYKMPDSNDLDSIFINAMHMFYWYDYFCSDYDEDNEIKYKTKAIEIIKELSEKKHPYACLIMGVLYNDGIFFLKNIQKSKEYLEKAYEYGFKTQSVKVWNDFGYE